AFSSGAPTTRRIACIHISLRGAKLVFIHKLLVESPSGRRRDLVVPNTFCHRTYSKCSISRPRARSGHGRHCRVHRPDTNVRWLLRLRLPALSNGAVSSSFPIGATCVAGPPRGSVGQGEAMPRPGEPTRDQQVIFP